MAIRRVRNIIFLKDVVILSLTAFGGPQGHFAMFLDMMVKKRGYLKEEDLIELFALCQVLPGPTSTQTITALGFKIGGPNLAYLTLFIWMLPAMTIMTLAGILVNTGFDLGFMRFILPMVVGVVGFSAFRIASRVVTTRLGFVLMIVAAIASFSFRSPFVFPVLILMGGLITTINYKKHAVEEKGKISIQWANLFLLLLVQIVAAGLGGITQYLPIKIFENFYRNGTLIFGGGQVLVPLLYTEFVEFKSYLTTEQFLSGYGFAQAMPGPVFSFSAYVGSISMNNFGVTGQILGAILATFGIFLPGTFMIFFVIRFWEQLKKYRIVKASLEGINAMSSGTVISATFLVLLSMPQTVLNYMLAAGTFLLLYFTRFPTPIIILAGLIVGILIG